MSQLQERGNHPFSATSFYPGPADGMVPPRPARGTTPRPPSWGHALTEAPGCGVPPALWVTCSRPLPAGVSLLPSQHPFSSSSHHPARLWTLREPQAPPPGWPWRPSLPLALGRPSWQTASPRRLILDPSVHQVWSARRGPGCEPPRGASSVSRRGMDGSAAAQGGGEELSRRRDPALSPSPLVSGETGKGSCPLLRGQ